MYIITAKINDIWGVTLFMRIKRLLPYNTYSVEYSTKCYIILYFWDHFKSMDRLWSLCIMHTYSGQFNNTAHLQNNWFTFVLNSSKIWKNPNEGTRGKTQDTLIQFLFVWKVYLFLSWKLGSNPIGITIQSLISIATVNNVSKQHNYVDIYTWLEAFINHSLGPH